MASARILCLTIPAFPAWAFHRPSPANQPLAVVAARRVVAACPHAERAGIAPGMPAGRIRALLPEARILQRDLHRERAVWEEVLIELSRITPFAESGETGVAFARADDLERLRALVARLGAQGGVASARSIARLAALRAARGNTLDVAPEHLTGFQKQFPLSLLPGLGYAPEFVHRLGLFGYHTLFGAASLSRRHLKAQFGDAGARLYDALHPGEERPIPLFQPPPAVTGTFDFDLPAREPGDLLPVLERLAEDAAGRLGARQCRRVRLTLSLHGSPDPVFACRVLPEAVADARRILQTAKTLLTTLMAPGREIDTVTLELGALQPRRFVQVSLFRERPSVFDVARMVGLRFPGALLRAVVRPHVFFEEDACTFEPFPTEAPAPHRARNSSRRK